MKGVRFYAFTAAGLEEIAAQEIAARLEGARLQERQRGMVFFEWGGDPEDLLKLGTTEDVFALVGRSPISAEREGLEQAGEMVYSSPWLEQAVSLHRRLRPRKVRRLSFRVVVQRKSGGQRYIRRELKKALEGVVERRWPRWKKVEDHALVELWALEQGGELVCGVRLSDRTMRHRTYKQAHIQASLRPTIARAMVLLSEPGDEDLFLDPMCGAGTLLIERAKCGRYRQLLGGDIRPSAIRAARANIGPRYKPIELWQWDAAALPLADGCADRVACNLPFGKKIGRFPQVRRLYHKFAAELGRVLKKGGVAVLLTSEKGVLEESLKRQQTLYVERLLPVFVLGQKAFIFKLRSAES